MGADWIADVRARLHETSGPRSRNERWLLLWELAHADIPRLLRAAEALERLVEMEFQGGASPRAWRAAMQEAEAALKGDMHES